MDFAAAASLRPSKPGREGSRNRTGTGQKVLVSLGIAARLLTDLELAN